MAGVEGSSKKAPAMGGASCGARSLLRTPNLSFLRLSVLLKRCKALLHGGSPFRVHIEHTHGSLDFFQLHGPHDPASLASPPAGAVLSLAHLRASSPLETFGAVVPAGSAPADLLSVLPGSDRQHEEVCVHRLFAVRGREALKGTAGACPSSSPRSSRLPSASTSRTVS